MLYFSVYGTTKKMAGEIARQAYAELMEIQPCVPYDSDRNHYSALARRAEREYSGTWQLIRRQAPKAMVPDGLCIEMADTDSKASALVSGWLQKLKLHDEKKQSIAI